QHDTHAHPAGTHRGGVERAPHPLLEASDRFLQSGADLVGERIDACGHPADLPVGREDRRDAVTAYRQIDSHRRHQSNSRDTTAAPKSARATITRTRLSTGLPSTRPVEMISTSSVRNETRPENSRPASRSGREAVDERRSSRLSLSSG